MPYGYTFCKPQCTFYTLYGLIIYVSVLFNTVIIVYVFVYFKLQCKIKDVFFQTSSLASDF
jgi:hypothetical protein